MSEKKQLQLQKYNLGSRRGKIVVAMPAGAELLNVDHQDGELRLWVLADPKAEKVDHAFGLFWTGDTFHEKCISDLDYLKTCVMPDGIVFHVFYAGVITGETDDTGTRH